MLFDVSSVVKREPKTLTFVLKNQRGSRKLTFLMKVAAVVALVKISAK